MPWDEFDKRSQDLTVCRCVVCGEKETIGLDECAEWESSVNAVGDCPATQIYGEWMGINELHKFEVAV